MKAYTPLLFKDILENHGTYHAYLKYSRLLIAPFEGVIHEEDAKEIQSQETCTGQQYSIQEMIKGTEQYNGSAIILEMLDGLMPKDRARFDADIRIRQKGDIIIILNCCQQNSLNPQEMSQNVLRFCKQS